MIFLYMWLFCGILSIIITDIYDRINGCYEGFSVIKTYLLMILLGPITLSSAIVVIEEHRRNKNLGEI